jgi:nucleoside 2-deoxyribosyltransferase
MFTVFISHSTKEPIIVWMFGHLLQLSGINVFVSEWIPEPGKPLPEKIQRQIDASDCVLALLTREGGRSPSVNQEVGYAIGKKKPIIPVVEEGVEVGVLLHGLEYVPFDRSKPDSAVNSAADYIRKLKLQKEQNNIVVALIGLFFFFLLLGELSRK